MFRLELLLLLLVDVREIARGGVGGRREGSVVMCVAPVPDLPPLAATVSGEEAETPVEVSAAEVVVGVSTCVLASSFNTESTPSKMCCFSIRLLSSMAFPTVRSRRWAIRSDASAGFDDDDDNGEGVVAGNTPFCVATVTPCLDTGIGSSRRVMLWLAGGRTTQAAVAAAGLHGKVAVDGTEDVSSVGYGHGHHTGNTGFAAAGRGGWCGNPPVPGGRR